MNKYALRIIPMLMLIICFNQICAQSLQYDVKFDGLFDNREFKGDMKPQTIYGLRLVPQIGIKVDKTSLMLGFTKNWDFGTQNTSAPNILLYLKYHDGGVTTYFGFIPRTNLQRQLPDAFLYDSIAYFDNRIQGMILQYQGKCFSTEVYCNWFSKQNDTRREVFRIVSDGSAGNGRIDGGWFIALTHFAKPATGDYHIYEKCSIYPFIAYNFGHLLPEELHARLSAGVLSSLIRLRAEDRWHTPVGFIGTAECGWRWIDIKNTLYAGGAQQPFLHAPMAGMTFHRSDPFYNHTFYDRTDFSLTWKLGTFTSAGFTWSLHFTPNTKIHNQQMIKISFNILHDA